MILFAQQGYAHTSIRNIAALAGISTGLMYHYYQNKDRLLQAVFENRMEVLSTRFTRALVTADPRRRLDALLHAMFDLLQSDRDEWALFFMMRSQPAVMKQLGDPLRQWTVRLRSLFVSELAQIGRSDPTMDAYILYSLIEGTIQQYLLDPDNYPLPAVTQHIITQYGS